MSSFAAEASSCARFDEHLQRYQSDINSGSRLKQDNSKYVHSAVITRIQSVIEISKTLNLVQASKLKVSNIKHHHNLGLSLATLNLMQLWAQQKTPNVVLLTNSKPTNNISELQLYRVLLMNEAYLRCQLDLEDNSENKNGSSHIQKSNMAIFKQLFTILKTFYENTDKSTVKKLIDLRALQIDYLLKSSLANLGYRSVVNWEDSHTESTSNTLYFSLLNALEVANKLRPNSYADVTFEIINMHSDDELLAEYVLITLLHIELRYLNTSSIGDISPPLISFIGQNQKIDSANKSIHNVLNNLLRLTTEDDL
mgnify:CR=1 FL=1